MSFRASGGVRWQVGRTLDEMRDCIARGDILTLADLTRFLIAVASPHLSGAEREKLVLGGEDVDWDYDGAARGRVMESCLVMTERVLSLLKRRGIYAQADTPNGGELSMLDDEDDDGALS